MVIELFHFRGLFSYGVRLDYFNEPRSLFAGREGDGRMKDKDHHIRHPRGHFGDRASAQGTRGCAWRDDQFGRGQNTVLGWSDPTFAHGSVPKVTRGSLQPNQWNEGLVCGVFCRRAQREFGRSR